MYSTAIYFHPLWSWTDLLVATIRTSFCRLPLSRLHHQETKIIELFEWRNHNKTVIQVHYLISYTDLGFVASLQREFVLQGGFSNSSQKNFDMLIIVVACFLFQANDWHKFYVQENQCRLYPQLLQSSLGLSGMSQCQILNRHHWKIIIVIIYIFIDYILLLTFDLTISKLYKLMLFNFPHMHNLRKIS